MKYKLIKEYPGSLKLGNKITKSTNGIWWIDENRKVVSFTRYFNPEDYPEFWEKVEDYVGVTSTGIHIKRHQWFYCVDKKDLRTIFASFVAPHSSQKDINDIEKNYYIFKTKEEARTHVQNLKTNQLFEKKCLSLNDVATIFKSASRESIFKNLENTNSQGYRLMEIAKETLNKSGYNL
jgi:hypothetical protein